jgi:aspartyl-tRNA(Asn)/glutamyl-tRNA(Gln) amidotransferase subunit B
LAKLTRLELTATQAKAVLAELVQIGGDPEAIAQAKGFEAMDASALDASIDAAIAAEPDVWAKYVAGDDKAVGRLVGSVMKATKGQADGKAVTAKLMERRAAASG